VLDTREILTEQLFIISKRKMACMANFIFIFFYMKHRTTEIAINLKGPECLPWWGEDLPQACLFSCLLTDMVDSYMDMVVDMRVADDMVEDTVEMGLAAAVVA